MILLTSTSDLIQVVTSSAAAVTVHSDYIDNAAGTETPVRNNSSISSATTTTVVGSPGSSVQRNVKEITIFNNDGSLACTVTVKHTDGSTPVFLASAVLQPGEVLQKLGEGPWTVRTASGIIKTSTNVPQLPAGTTTLPALRFTAGTNEASPASGDVEYDGVVAYLTALASERGVIDAEQFIMLSAAYTLTSQTAAQKMFNAPASGQVTVGGSRTYEFECLFSLSSMSGSSGSFGFALGGGATFTNLAWVSRAQKGAAALTTATAIQETFNTTTANTTIATASTNTVGYAEIRGILRVNAGGTIIPQVSLGVAAAAVVGVNSRFRLWPVGSNTVQSIGNWS